MKLAVLSRQMLALAWLLVCIDSPICAQSRIESLPQWGGAEHQLPPGGFPYQAAGSDIRLVGATEYSSHNDNCLDPGCQQCCPKSSLVCADPGLFVGVEYLLIRPHFSEAIAFAQGTQTATTFQTIGRELQFDYESSFRVFTGYRAGNGGGELRLTYWHSQADISVDGTVGGPGEFIVDPFGNLVGGVVVIDPADARFGNVLVGGDLIRTTATVQTNVYDLDFIQPILLRDSSWSLSWSAGVRLADIDQYYESVITNGGAFFSRGDFFADFIGAGPRLGIGARRHFGRNGRFSLFVNGHGALLVGEDVIRSNVAPNVVFSLSQQESLTRTLPVIETELGASWQAGSRLNLSAGWLFQAWFDMGTSGGQFGGFFAGADDSNVMSFDGLSLRAEYSF